MAKVVWTGPASRDVQEIAEYIALDNRTAARNVVLRIEKRVSQLRQFPELGSFIPENPAFMVKQLVEPPCRIFYEIRGNEIYILHVLRFERLLRLSRLQDD